MDVVRITQALKQQQPGRHTSARGGNNTLSATSSESTSIRRPTWDNTLSIDTASTTTTSAVRHENPQMEQDNRTSPGGSTSSASSVSPSNSFFSLPSPLALAAGFFSGGSVDSAVSASRATPAGNGVPNVGEIESLLLRSMPMFGNLVSRD
ncbi:hypothetical protein BGZ76_000604 [Entomortierella beljakovae]|nr:hypothetical protein BGZ76_000604 [Entomortierella beljakovae]